MFICPAFEVALSLPKSHTWVYRYNVPDADYLAAGYGVPHVIEKPAVFGADMLGGSKSHLYGPGGVNSPMVPIVMNYWTSFVTSLDPNTHKYKTAPNWPDWGSSGGERLLFELGNSRMEAVSSSQFTRCNVWKSLSGHTEQ